MDSLVERLQAEIDEQPGRTPILVGESLIRETIAALSAATSEEVRAVLALCQTPSTRDLIERLARENANCANRNAGYIGEHKRMQQRIEELENHCREWAFKAEINQAKLDAAKSKWRDRFVALIARAERAERQLAQALWFLDNGNHALREQAARIRAIGGNHGDL